jgi:hypothetical protein
MNRTLSLAAATALIFGATVAVLLFVIPGPRKPTDYLVIGAVATFACLLLLFFLLVKSAKRN